MQPSKYSFSQNSGQYQKLDIGKDNILILNSLRSIFEKLKQINRRFTNKTFDIELEGEKEFYSFSDIVDIVLYTLIKEYKNGIRKFFIPLRFVSNSLILLFFLGKSENSRY